MRNAVIVALAAIASWAPPAEAQSMRGAPQSSQVRRPYRALFGAPSDPQTPQSLVFSASVFGAYDTNRLAGLVDRRSVNSRLQDSGFYSGASMALQYHISRNIGRGALNAFGSAHAGIYHVRDRWSVVPHYNGGVSYSTPLARHTSFSARYGVAYAHNYRFQLYPDLFAPEDTGAAAGGVEVDGPVLDTGIDTYDPDLDLFSRSNLRHSAGVTISHQLSTRSSVSAQYHAGYVDYASQDFSGLLHQGVSFGYHYDLTQNATLHLGYGYSVARYRAGDSRKVQNINAGVNYSRSLSISRRTSVSFSTGSALVQSDRIAPDRDPTSRFRFIGTAALNHEIGRSWTANVAYHRRVLFRENFATPFYSDGIAASVRGVVNRRVSVSGGARWSLSATDYRGDNRHRGTAAFAQATFGITRFLAGYARYIYYSYRFGDAIPIADPLLERALDRQGVRVGLTTSIPIFR